MKLTTKRLKELIKEELGRLNEFFGPSGNIPLAQIKEMLLAEDPGLQYNKWYQKLLQIKMVSGGDYNYYDWEEDVYKAGNSTEDMAARKMYYVHSIVMKKIDAGESTYGSYQHNRK